MVYEFLGLLVESYGTWLLQRLVDASKDSDIPKNVPFAFAINNRNTKGQGCTRMYKRFFCYIYMYIYILGACIGKWMGNECAVFVMQAPLSYPSLRPQALLPLWLAEKKMRCRLLT